MYRWTLFSPTAGSVGGSLPSPAAYLAGASAGVYALIGRSAQQKDYWTIHLFYITFYILRWLCSLGDLLLFNIWQLDVLSLGYNIHWAAPSLVAAHLATLVLNWKEDGAVFEARRRKSKAVSQSLNPLIRYHTLHCTLYTLRNVLADFAICDWLWRYFKVLCDVQFSQKEGNGRNFCHIELSNIVTRVKFSNSEGHSQQTYLRGEFDSPVILQISVFGSSWNFSASTSLNFFLFLFNCIPKAVWDAKK